MGLLDISALIHGRASLHVCGRSFDLLFERIRGSLLFEMKDSY